jgi:hypothetical protein
VDARKIFVEDFYKEIFFVLVCGPILLIENFLTPAKPARGAELAALENEGFLLQSFNFGPLT